jgi:hypothetical protein
MKIVLDVLSGELEASHGSRKSIKAQEKLNSYFDKKKSKYGLLLYICLISGSKKCESVSDSGSGCTKSPDPDPDSMNCN